MISVFKKYCSYYYSKKLNYFYYKVEQDHFFSSLLSTYELNRIKKEKNISPNAINEDENIEEEYLENNYYITKEMSNKIIEKYLSGVDLTSNKEDKKNGNLKFIEMHGKNELNIILGLKLPGVNSIITSIIQKFKKEINIYRFQEDKLRTFLESNEIDEIIRKNRDKLNVLINNIFIELERNVLLSEILNTNNNYEKDTFYKLILEDYYTLFIEKIFHIYNKNRINKRTFKDIKKMLKLIIKLRNDYHLNDEIGDPIKMTISSIIWIECYLVEIGNILNIFIKLNSITDNLYGEIEYIINHRNIKNVIQQYTSIVNKILFYGLESILKVMTSKGNIYIEQIKMKLN